MTREGVLRRHVGRGTLLSWRHRRIRCVHPKRDGEECSRLAAQHIQGLGFCTQHAKMVQRDLEADEGGSEDG